MTEGSLVEKENKIVIKSAGSIAEGTHSETKNKRAEDIISMPQ